MDERAAVERAEFGAALAKLRRERGWRSQEALGNELAKLARHHFGRNDGPPRRQTVSRWELGQCFPDAQNGYLLCRLFLKEPEELGLHRVVTPAVMAHYESLRKGCDTRVPVETEGHRDDPPEVDWERVAYALRAMGQVDSRTVDDMWSLTHRYLDDRRRMRGRPLLGLMIEHVVRLRQLRSRPADEGHRRELAIMLGQALIGSGLLWTGLMDFGMSVMAYREAAALGEELGEEWLRTTALMTQAQLGGIHALPPWPQDARRALIEEVRGGVVGASAQARVWLHATRAQMYAILREHAEAQRALELADRAQAVVPTGSGFYFGMTDPCYLPIQRASVALMAGRPREASALFERIAEGIDPENRPIMAWVTVYGADAAAAAGDMERAAPLLAEAQRIVREIEAPLLEHSVHRIAARERWMDDQPSPGRRHQLDMNP